MERDKSGGRGGEGVNEFRHCRNSLQDSHHAEVQGGALKKRKANETRWMRRRGTGPVLTTKNEAAENMKARCVAVCSSVLQWVAVCCSVKISEVRRNESLLRITFKFVGKLLAEPLYVTSHSHGRNAKTSAHTLLSDKECQDFSVGLVLTGVMCVSTMFASVSFSSIDSIRL